MLKILKVCLLIVGVVILSIIITKSIQVGILFQYKKMFNNTPFFIFLRLM